MATESQKGLVVEGLNRNIAAAVDMWARVKHAHWNVRGPTFIGIHRLFDEIAEHAEGYADTMAEHCRYYEMEAYGTAKAAAGSYLGPYAVGIADEGEHIGAVLASLVMFDNAVRASLREALGVGDQITGDIYIEIGRGVAKDIYLLRSHVEG